MRGQLNKLDELFHAGKVNAFWQHVKKSRKYFVRSDLNADAFAGFYRNVMTDDGVLTSEQKRVADQVDQWLRDTQPSRTSEVSRSKVACLVKQLNNNCSPGIDGVTGEHLKIGLSDVLCSALSCVLSSMLSLQLVPSSFKTGVIVPILKKPGLNTTIGQIPHK